MSYLCPNIYIYIYIYVCLTGTVDFGLSKRLSEEETIVGAVGSSYYVAPEVLTGKHCKNLEKIPYLVASRSYFSVVCCCICLLVCLFVCFVLLFVV